MDKLLILGVGGHGRVVRESVLAVYPRCSVAFLDDYAGNVAGRCEDLYRLRDHFDFAFAAFGDNLLRRKWIDKVIDAGYIVPAVINPSAYISPSAVIGIGAFVGAKAVVNTGVTLGRGCIVNIGAMIDHDAVLGDYAHVAAGAVVTPLTVTDGLIYIGAGTSFSGGGLI